MNGKNLNRRSARRRVRTRTALFLCLFGAAGMALVSVLAGAAGSAFAPWISMAGSVLFYAVPAYLGLFKLDGNQSRMLLRGKLSSAQMLWLALGGALLVCPSLLLSGVIGAAAQRFGAAYASVQAAPAGAMLLPVLLASAVVAPVCEEVFFRGYLLGVFARVGRGRAALLSSLLFAAAHGMSMETPVLVLIGLLFAAAAWHTQSLLAPIVMHMAYNLTLVLLAFGGLGGLLGIGNPFSAALLLAGSAGFVYALLRMWRAQGAYEQMQWPQGNARTRWLCALGLALLLALAAQAVAQWQAHLAAMEVLL